MKFSIIIPVYNVEKYIKKCLESVHMQSYKNYEVIIVNDGTKDNSQQIIDEFIQDKEKFICVKKENGGLSDARNYGLQYVTGDYILFLDSDDYIEKDLLLNLSEVANGNDVIKFKLNIVDETGNVIRKENGLDIQKNINFGDLIGLEFLEPSWSYAYDVNFWRNNNFSYEKGRIHEDFGLTPYILANAETIYYLNYYGYNYVKREGSIMNGATKNKRRAEDVLYHFDNLKTKIDKTNVEDEIKKLFMSFIANGVISTASLLKKEDLNSYITEIKKRELYKYLFEDTFARKIKKWLIKTNIKLYLKLFK